MDKEHLLKKAKKFKKVFETMLPLDIPYVNSKQTFWCVNYKRFSENSGFLIIPEQDASYDEKVEAYWHIAMSSSLINGVSKGMVGQRNKSLDYLENLNELFEKWQLDHYAEAKEFVGEINQFNELVDFYQRTQNEIDGLHRKLLQKSDEITSNKRMEKQDTEDVFSICSLYNYLIYTQGIKQQYSLKPIQSIQQRLKSQADSGLKELKKYVDYYLHPKSVGYLTESLKDFKEYGTHLANLPREEGTAAFLRIYKLGQKEIFKKEFMPLLRK